MTGLLHAFPALSSEIDRSLANYSAKGLAPRLLRWSLGLVYLWFGTLKLASRSPALPMIRDSYPHFAVPPFLCILTGFEILLALMLLFNLWTRLAAVMVMFHLSGTLAVLVYAPRLAFVRGFPFLSLDGEFVVKNLVLIAAAAALLLCPARQVQAGAEARAGLAWQEAARLSSENAGKGQAS